jgi:hypothetical protein
MTEPAHMPSFDGATGWLNSPPLSTDALRGHVVAVQFCTFSCINWIRTLPHTRAWAHRYERDGLVVIGAHSPEFAFEHDTNAIADALKERDINYPVAIDNDFAIWSAFSNNYWPALYIADDTGILRYHHYGEGSYEQSEQVIRQLVGADGIPEPISIDRADEIEADWNALKSPETYVGYERTSNFASPSGQVAGRSHRYALPPQLLGNQWALSGLWTIGSNSASLDEPTGQIAFRFHARDLNLVMGCAGVQPISFRVTLDGRSPGVRHGLDVDEDGNGWVAKPRMYQLIRQFGTIAEHTFEVAFQDAGVDAYVFTFG